MTMKIHLVSGFGGNEDMMQEEISDLIRRLEDKTPGGAVWFRPKSKWEEISSELESKFVQEPEKLNLGRYLAWHATIEVPT